MAEKGTCRFKLAAPSLSSRGDQGGSESRITGLGDLGTKIRAQPDVEVSEPQHFSRKVLGERSSLVCVRVERGFWQKSGILALEYAGMVRGRPTGLGFGGQNELFLTIKWLISAPGRPGALFGGDRAGDKAFQVEGLGISCQAAWRGGQPGG